MVTDMMVHQWLCWSFSKGCVEVFEPFIRINSFCGEIIFGWGMKKLVYKQFWVL
jgi:hypothetical protein